MPINITDIISKLNPEIDKKSRFESLILDLLVLKQKLENPELQSWYFQKALEQNQVRYISYRSSFENIRQKVNSTTIDELISKQNEALELKKSLTEKTTYPLFSHVFRLSGVTANLNSIKMIMQIKTRIGELQELDYYLEDENRLMKLLGW